MDRRVRKTRRALRESLFSLVAERGWDSVSVQHVCERADVGRSTFYTHFADREDLLLSGFDDLKLELRAMGPGPAARPFGSFVPRGSAAEGPPSRDGRPEVGGESGPGQGERASGGRRARERAMASSEASTAVTDSPRSRRWRVPRPAPQPRSRACPVGGSQGSSRPKSAFAGWSAVASRYALTRAGS